MSEVDRLRWHCRRGLLELDLVLARFLDGDFPRLDAAGRAAFGRLLELPDNDLWDLIAGRADQAPGLEPAQAELLARLRRC